MRNLIFLFVKHGGFLTFFLAEIFCMYLVVNNNSEQNAIFNSSFSFFSNETTERFDNLKQFVSLSSVNDTLARANAKLLQEKENAKFIQTVFKDSIQIPDTEQLYTFTAAKVVSNSTTRHNNSIIINRGANHGIKPSMGIIGVGNAGVVGIVKNTTANHSRVLPILHSQSRISASIKRNNFFGGLVWQGRDPTKANLVDIPKHANLVKGDTIQTSGYSSIFPEGIMIGTIDTSWLQKGTNFYEIEVNLCNDLSSVKYVYVVENLMKKEIDALEKEVSDD